MADALLLRNCRFPLPEGGSFAADLLLEDGSVRGIGRELAVPGAEVLDAGGLFAAPGLVDMHVHLRDPGFRHKETIASGCRAALAGGVTTLLAMPNTNPVADNPEVLRYVLEKASGTGVNVLPAGAVSLGQKGESLSDFAALKEAGAAAFTDDGRPVSGASLMLEALRAAHGLGAPVLSHCEELSLAAGGLVNDGAAETLGVKPLPAAAEEAQAARDIALSESCGLPVHLMHLSTAKSLELVRAAKRRGAPVTCETCPHYFSLDESYTLGRDADYRMNPPLRTREDVQAVRAALKDGTVDCIVTDHAPHAPGEKAGFATAPNGVIGLETSLAAGITWLVKPGVLTLYRLLCLMSRNPARILGTGTGFLRPGSRADVVLFDPEERWEVRPEALFSLSRNTPFKGMTLTGRVKYTIAGGRILHRPADTEVPYGV